MWNPNSAWYDLTIVLGIFALGGFLAVMAGAALVVHGWWLPRHGINGWTAEPYDRYLELVTRRRARGGQG